MDSDEGKVFIGGISWETDEEKLRGHFGRYGDIAEAVVMRDKESGRPRGFGFVVLSDPSLVKAVLLEKHVIDGRTVEVKQALSRGEQHTGRSTNPATVKALCGKTGGNVRTKKIFVGGLPSSLTEEHFRQYFEVYGAVTDAVIMFDQSTQRPRGFGFVSFDSEGAVDLVLHKTFHDLDGKLVEVKRALPKDANPSGRSAGGSISSHSFDSSTANAGSYDGKIDGNRYIQQQATGGGYPSYGVPGYGYGTPGGAVGYGGYGVGRGYGDANAASYGGPSGSYGNPTTGGYARSPWSSQIPSGYAPGGYGANSGYGSAAWNYLATGSGNFAPAGHLSIGTGYGGHGYGYGGYGISDGQYATRGGYGAAGGSGGHTGNAGGSFSDQGAGYSYTNGAYGDASGAAAYPNAWRAEPQQGGYAATQADEAPYDGAQSRHPQQQ